jgi:hypothetical protein
MPAHRGILRNRRERGEDLNLDRRERICAGRHGAHTARHRGMAAPDSTDSQNNSIRENADFTAFQNMDCDNDLGDIGNR